MKQSFQNGVDTLYNKCVSCGSTPSNKTPTSISNSIQSIYNNRYNAGVSATKKGNATVGNVLSGKTFTSTAGVNLTGTMPNRGNLSWSSSNTTYSVPAGYYSGGTLDSRPSYTAGYNNGYNAGQQEGIGSNVVLIGGGYGNRSGFNFSKSGLNFKKCLLVYSFSAYYMRPEADGWGIISATGISLSLLSKQWFNTYRNTGLAMFIYNGTDVQDTITVTARVEGDGTTSTMVVYCIY